MDLSDFYKDMCKSSFEFMKDIEVLKYDSMVLISDDNIEHFSIKLSDATGGRSVSHSGMSYAEFVDKYFYNSAKSDSKKYVVKAGSNTVQLADRISGYILWNDQQIVEHFLASSNINLRELLYNFSGFVCVNSHYTSRFKSVTQLWLAYFMHFQYGKEYVFTESNLERCIWV